MKKIITALILGIILISTWYFYPCFEYKGTYIGTFHWKGSDSTSVVIIGDKYTAKGMNIIEVDYQLKPLKRMIQVELPDNALDMEVIPVKLGWNSINQPVMFGGWVKHKKQNSEQGN